MYNFSKNSNSIKEGLDSEPRYNRKYLKTKTESYEGKITTNFHDEEHQKKVLIFLSISIIEWFCF